MRTNVLGLPTTRVGHWRKRSNYGSEAHERPEDRASALIRVQSAFRGRHLVVRVQPLMRWWRRLWWWLLRLVALNWPEGLEPTTLGGRLRRWMMGPRPEPQVMIEQIVIAGQRLLYTGALPAAMFEAYQVEMALMMPLCEPGDHVEVWYQNQGHPAAVVAAVLGDTP